MFLHQLRSTQRLNVPLAEAWAFFCAPENLNDITPEELQFRIVTPVPPVMYPGMIVEYRIKAIPGVWQTWVTEITHVDDGRSFIDEQRFGPYRFWHHRHVFEDHGDHVVMHDVVNYALPFGPLGSLVHWLIVGAKVRRIFAFRYAVLERRFNTKS